MKELEALEKLIVEDGFRVVSKDDERYIIVRKGLERLEKLEKAIALLKNFTLTESFGLNLTLKEFNEAWLLSFTEEEFNLLKEVFGNGQ